MKNLQKHLGDPRRTSPRDPIPGLESEMHLGPAGGYVFEAGDWERLDRFLIIGTEGGTYYAGERDLTRASADVVRRCLAADAPRTICRIAEVSDQGLAPRNDPAILALAIAFCLRGEGVPGELRRRALQKVCRTGTHLFQFLQAARGMRGGGRALNGAVRAWIDAKWLYRSESPILNPGHDQGLALQMVKYRSRAGWTWRDVMRRYRPRPPKLDHIEDSEDKVRRYHLYAWAAGRKYAPQWLPAIVQDFEKAASLPVEELAAHVAATRLPWECVPSEHTTRRDVLGALLENMPVMATVRQLSKLQAHGVLEERRDVVLARLRDEAAIAKSRIHPVALLIAAGAYETGSGRNLTWRPDPAVVDALDDAFQLALKGVEPTGKRVLVAIDVSGSMRGVSGFSNIPLHKLAAAFALTYVRSDSASVVGFDAEPATYGLGMGAHNPYRNRAGIYPLAISGRQRVTDVVRMVGDLGAGGGTDCGLPFRWARGQGLKVDVFLCLTDNESWAGPAHPAQELQLYRDHVNPAARCVWMAMTAGDSSLGLPDDRGVLGICGLDASAPQLVAGFVAGRF